MPTPAEKRATFRKLHAQGCFVIPNPWDVGSARYLQGLGFKALATTSSGFAFTQGCPDGAVPRATMLAHFREIAAAADVPARAAIDRAGGDVVFTARSEGFIRGRPDLDETVRRLQAFAAAGADCLYAP